VEDNSRKPRDLLKNRHSDSLKKSELTLSQGMMNKGDVVVADEDDKLRTSASQNHVTTALCTEEFFLSADMCEGGQFIYCTDGQRNTYV
jgi:hypothetical protein